MAVGSDRLLLSIFKKRSEYLCVELMFEVGFTQCYEWSCTWHMHQAEEPAAISIILTVILHLNLNHLYRIVFLFTAMEISNIRATALHPAPNVLYILLEYSIIKNTVAIYIAGGKKAEGV